MMIGEMGKRLGNGKKLLTLLTRLPSKSGLSTAYRTPARLPVLLWNGLLAVFLQ